MTHRSRFSITATDDHTEHRVTRDRTQGGDIIRQWRTRGDGTHTVTIHTVHPQYGRLQRGTIRRSPDGGWTFTDHEFHSAPHSYPDYIDAEDSLIASTSGLDTIEAVCPECRTQPARNSGLCLACTLATHPAIPLRTKPTHHDGDPWYCGQGCPGPHHTDQAPAICPECGGSGRACRPECTERPRRYDPWDGRTGIDEFYADYD